MQGIVNSRYDFDGNVSLTCKGKLSTEPFTHLDDLI